MGWGDGIYFKENALLFLLFNVTTSIIRVMGNNMFLFYFFERIFVGEIDGRNVFVSSLFRNITSAKNSFFVSSYPNGNIQGQTKSQGSRFFHSSYVNDGHGIGEGVPIYLPTCFIT